jgi:large subunit ribosomal protein L21
MYAVIETGGKQYRVEVGTQLEVELIDASAGDTAEIGRPTVAAASVSAEVLRQERGEKVISFKYRPKARRRVKKGHRQELHVLRIADIVLNGKSAAEVVKKAATEASTERQRLEEAARRQAAEDAALAAKLAAAKAAKAEATVAAGAAKAKTPARKPAAKAEATSEAAPKTPARKPKTAKAAEPPAPGVAEADAPAAPKKPRATMKDE